VTLQWVAEYHNEVITTRVPGHPDLLVSTSVITSQFKSFV
jgi:hypothetical protein